MWETIMTSEDEIKREIEELDRLIKAKQNELDLAKSNINIPIEEQDINFPQPSIPSPFNKPMPPMLPFRKPTPQYQQPMPYKNPNEKITLRTVAYEVSKELMGKRMMAMVGIFSSFIVAAVMMFNRTYGMISIVPFVCYFIFEIYRAMSKFNYLRMTYGT
jgi:hypothetical protein